MRNLTLLRFYTILKLLELNKDPIGKTALQKAIYLLQEGYNLDLAYRFKLYLYGPYSDQLSIDLDVLKDNNLISVDFDDIYGYQIKITNEGQKFIKKFEPQVENIDEINTKINKLLSLPEKMTAREMELLGTTLYFMKQTKEVDQLVRSIKMLKPRFSEDEIREAIKKLANTFKRIESQSGWI